MARKKKLIRKVVVLDKKFRNALVHKTINKIMLNGKKTVAERIVYSAIDLAGKKLNKEPLEVFNTALNNVAPVVQLKGRRIGGANYQIPTEVSGDRRIILALQWIISAARHRKGMPMDEKLAIELIDAFNNTGGAIKKKEETHRMAEANRAFTHFARF